MTKTNLSSKYKLFLMFIHQADINWTLDTQVNILRIAKWEKLFYQAYDDLESGKIAIQSEPYIKCRRFIKNALHQHDNNIFRGMKADCIIVDDLHNGFK